MKLLFLCKRFPQGRDLLTRPYGRFYHIPRLLAERGHQVHVALLSYRRMPSIETTFDGIQWTSDDLWPNGIATYLGRQRQLVDAMRPDWIIGCSDTYFGIMARRLASAVKAHCAIDAYDNFESYIPWAAPLHWFWRAAVRSADLTTVANPQLAARMHRHGALHCEILPMAADPAFREIDRRQCRVELGLPLDRQLIGQIGAFDSRRGRGVVLQALDQVRKDRPDVSLVLSGKASTDFHRPPFVYGVGYVPDQQLPYLVNCLDIACVALANNEFGRYSSPAKLCEAMACNIPVVASATGPVRWMLGDDSRFLVRTGDARAMAEKIVANLRLGRSRYDGQAAWADVAMAFEAMLAGNGKSWV